MARCKEVEEKGITNESLVTTKNVNESNRNYYLK